MIGSRYVTWGAYVPSPSHEVTPMSGCGEGRNTSAGLRPEEVESSEEGVEYSESEAEFGSEGSEREPANVKASVNRHR